MLKISKSAGLNPLNVMAADGLSGGRAVVLAGSNGRRLTIAEGLQDAGAEVAFVSCNLEKPERSPEKMGQHNGRNVYAACSDVTKWVHFQDAVSRLDHEPALLTIS